MERQSYGSPMECLGIGRGGVATPIPSELGTSNSVAMGRRAAGRRVREHVVDTNHGP